VARYNKDRNNRFLSRFLRIVMTFHRIIKPGLALAVCALISAGWAVPAAQATITSRAVQEEVTPDIEEDIEAEIDGAEEDVGESDDADHAVVQDEAQNVMPPMPPVAADELPAAPTAVLPQRVPQIQPPNPENIRPRVAIDTLQVERKEKPYVEPVGSTHPALYLTPDKSTIVRLDEPAASIVIGNEAHISVLIDTPRTLIVVPRQAGASYFTVMDAQSRIIMQRHVIVGPADQYVRVRRSCGTAGNCESTSVFYCPDGMCHPVAAPAAGPVASQTESLRSEGGAVGTNDNAGVNNDPVAE
jgi:hypothetical protein